jgi:hypothetical protein
VGAGAWLWGIVVREGGAAAVAGKRAELRGEEEEVASLRAAVPHGWRNKPRRAGEIGEAARDRVSP